MSLPRTFVGFSSTDLHCYRLMTAWKATQTINMAGYYIMLIGEDTRYKHKYVTWEAEVAIEQGCTIIGVNLNMSWPFDDTRTPGVLRDIGAVFAAFSPQIVAHALENYEMKDAGNFKYPEDRYRKLGYTINGGKVSRPSQNWRSLFE